MKKESRSKQKKASGGKEYVVVSYLFVFIFLALIGYMVYFNVYLSEDFMNSPYNKRQDKYEERVVRGDIRSSDGETLATTQVDAEGNEYRVYPYEDVFAHVVGYVSNGKSGLETLGNYQMLSSHAFVLEQVQKEFQDQKNVGDTVVSTLDTKLQRAAYDALGSYNGAIVVMEPDTGKILAMVSKPDFNPNTLAADWEELVADESNTNLLNRATQGMYAPGSTFKIVTSLAYMREHNNLDDFTFDCEGELTNGGYTIHCYNNNVHGHENFATSFAKSCNSAFAQIGIDLKRKNLTTVPDELLFNSKLPIDLPYSKSKFTLEKNSADALVMQTAIGQGDTLTSPMHMAMITSAIANGGNLMKPYLIDYVESYTGSQVKKYSPSIYKNLMTASEAQTLSNLMQGVVQEGTGSALNGQSYTAAGKTGTAEHGDMTGSPHAWFVGFSNVDNPDIVVSVIAESAGTGSDVAVPIAKQIFDAYYN